MNFAFKTDEFCIQNDEFCRLFISFAQFRRLDLRVNMVFNAARTGDGMLMITGDADEAMEQVRNESHH